VRIAVIAPPWVPVPPPAYGGTELVLDNLCRGLADQGHDVLLFATGDSTCPVELGWEHEIARGIGNFEPATELRHVFAAYARAIEWGADIVHDHTMSGPIYSDRFPGITVVTTAHGPFEGDCGAVYRAFAKSVPVIAISRHQAATAHVPIAAVIHHGIDCERNSMGKGKGGYAAFLGRMSPTKGVTIAIRAARAAGIPLRIAAKMEDYDEHEYFAEHVKPLLGGDVEYVGEVGGDTKQHLLGDAMCLLNPIMWPEPFGMVMIEALACGTPVVSTPAGAAPEIIDDGVTGFLRSDEAALAIALGKVGSIDRQTCRLVAEERFSIVRLAAEHAALFARLIEANG
jgi:glycosyltransferase involved in cell wall biosynthesis